MTPQERFRLTKSWTGSKPTVKGNEGHNRRAGRFHPACGTKLAQLYEYIASAAGEYRAESYVGRIVSYCQGLSVFPQRGARRDDLIQGLRTVGFERRVTIAFVVAAETVIIEGVFYGGQDFEAWFRE